MATSKHKYLSDIIYGYQGKREEGGSSDRLWEYKWIIDGHYLAPLSFVLLSYENDSKPSSL